MDEIDELDKLYDELLSSMETNVYSDWSMPINPNSVGVQRLAKLFPNANADFTFNLQDFIIFDIKNRYLPVRAMTSNNMQVLGNVAIVGCNPPSGYDDNQFEIGENDKTEYFVFPRTNHLYQVLVNKVKSMEVWEPSTEEWKTTSGSIHGKNRIVHINSLLLK